MVHCLWFTVYILRFRVCGFQFAAYLLSLGKPLRKAQMAASVSRVTCYVLRVTCYVLRVTCYVLRVKLACLLVRYRFIGRCTRFCTRSPVKCDV